MAALKTISRRATTAFAPGEALIAAGTAAGSVDPSCSTCLEVYKLDFASSDEELALVGTCATSTSVNRLSWGSYGLGSQDCSYGLLAGALADGNVDVWNPAAILREYESGQTSSPLATLEHGANVRGLEFSIGSPNLLASGGTDGTVLIWDLTNTSEPVRSLQFSSGDGEISCVSWNRKVTHIFATSSSNGLCVIGDTKKQKNVLSFPADPKLRKRCSSIHWNPEASTQLIVALEDDKSPMLQVWDLRNISAPTKELLGHNQGVLSLAFCPNDSSVLLSSGRDKKLLCWNVEGGEVASVMRNDESTVFDVQWSPKLPGIFSASSDAGNVGIYNIEGCNRVSLGYGSGVYKAPKWTKRLVGASFGFGGKLVSFTPSGKDPSGKDLSSEVKIHSLKTEEDLVARSSAFEAVVSVIDQKESLRSFCDQKLGESKSDEDREIWAFLKVMLVNSDGARKMLLNELGFQPPDTLSDELAQKADISEEGVSEASQSQYTDENSFQMIDDGEDFFDNLQAPKDPVPAAEASEEDHEFEADALDSHRDSEEAIDNALVVGDFKQAVEVCKSINRVFDALFIAQAGGKALLEQTQNYYLKKSQCSYLKTTSALINQDFRSLVETRPLSAWKKTLALLHTFASSGELEPLIDTLASRLDMAGQTQAATICYICAGNVEKTTELFSRVLDSGEHVVSDLQDLVEKTVVLNIATDKKRVGPVLAKVIEKYVGLLASQGLLQTAATYLSLVPTEASAELEILQDRIYRSGEVADTGAASSFPFKTEELKVPQAHVQSPAPEAFQGYQYSPNHMYQNGQFPPAQTTKLQYAPPSQQSAYNPPAYFQPLTQAPAPSFVPSVPPTPASTVPAASPFMPQAQSTASYISSTPTPITRYTPTPPVQPGAFVPPTSRPGMFPSRPVVPPSVPAVAPVAPAPAPVAAPPPAAPQAPTVQNVDTSNVKDELKPVVDTFRRLFNDTAQALGPGPMKKREIDDNSKRLGGLMAKLNAEDISPATASKLVLLCQSLDARDYAAANQAVTELTTNAWDECGTALMALKRMIKTQQTVAHY